MRKKNEINMYIDYEKSYRRRRRGYNTFLGVVIVFVLAFLVGIGTYYAIRIKTGGDYSLRKNRPHEANNGNLKNISAIETDNTDGNYFAEDTADSVNGKDDKITDNSQADKTADNENIKTDNKQDGEPADNTEGKTEDKPENGQESNAVYKEEDPRKPVRVKGMYVTSRAIMDKREKLIEIADTTEINAMVIDVKDDNGRITFKMENTMAHEIGATTNTVHDIADLMKLFEEKEIYPIARIVAFKDPYLAEKNRNMPLKTRTALFTWTITESAGLILTIKKFGTI